MSLKFMMLEKKFYTNGQSFNELVKGKLTCYYKKGRIEYRESFIDNKIVREMKSR